MQRVFETIRSYKMIEENDVVIVGVSGGADSVCLLFVLQSYQKEKGFQLAAVHVEHGIRGDESVRDANFVESLCKSMGIPIKIVRTDANKRAALDHCSLEEAARKVRYEAFEEAAIFFKGTKIATAHNQNDQAETVLWNLIRGTGARGLGGIRPVRECYIRPLLFVPREEIEAYLKERDISYCTDSTNLECDYSRNKLRNKVYPYLERELNSQVISHVAQTGAKMQDIEAYLEKETGKALKRCLFFEKEEIILDTKELGKEEALIREYMYRECLKKCGCGLKNIGKIHLNQIEQLLLGQPGRQIMLPGGYAAVLEQRGLWFGAAKKRAQKQEIFQPLEIPGEYREGNLKLILSLETFENQKIPEKIYTKWLDYDKIESMVCLRSRKSGDYLVVNHAGGRKKLKAYFIDEKIPREERDRHLLLAEGSHILWIIGKRISEAYKVTKDTKTLLKIQIVEE